MPAAVESRPLTPEGLVAPGRRNSNGRRLSGFKPQDVENFFDDNDDAEEKAKAAAEKKAVQDAKKAQKPKSPFRPTPGHERRQAMYQDVLQMTTENKVNEKNSWSLDFIDHMGKMLGAAVPGATDVAAQMTNFQLASTTLDAGVKIFSYRVDSVYTETFKLIGGLNRTSGKKADEEEDELAEGAEGAEGEEGAAPKTARKPKRKPLGDVGMLHLEANPLALNVKKLEMSFDVDPLFHRTSAKFDEGGAKGLLLNNLPVHHGCEVVFDSSDAGPTPAPAPAAAAPLPTLPWAAIGGLLPRGTTAHVAPEFAQLWAGVRPGAGSAPVEDESDDEDEEAADEARIAAEAAAAAEEEACAIGAQTLEIDASQLDGGYDESFDTGFDGDDDDMDDDTAAREAALMASGDGDEGAAAFMTIDEMAEGAAKAAEGATGAEEEEEVLEPEVAAAKGLLSEQAQRLLHVGQRWAGPGHWKFRAPSRAAAEEGAKVKSKKAAFMLDFSKSVEVAAAIEAAPLDAKGTLLSAAARARSKDAETTLPHDCHCSVDALECLFDQPTHRVKYGKRKAKAKSAAGGGGGAALDDIDVAIMEGTDDEGPAGFDNDDDDGPADFGFADAPDWGADAPPGVAACGVADGGAFSMVAAPSKVAKVDIGYAKVATQVDIKALKNDLWELLCDSDGTVPAKPAKGKAAAEPVGGDVSFQQVVGRLGERVPQAKLQDCSFAYSFICLLHLANEKGLEIESVPTMDDLKVTGHSAGALM